MQTPVGGTTAAHNHRQKDYDRFLNGQGIDIGCGNDPLKLPGREIDGWDLQDGDAQTMEQANGCCLALGQYDFVYSSHCLEHMRDVQETLRNWSRILKMGGYAYIVVPDYLLYERCQWPSRYNPDHKQSFTLIEITKEQSHDKLWNLEAMMGFGANAGLELINAKMEVFGYDWHMIHRGDIDQTLGGACANIVYVFRKMA